MPNSEHLGILEKGVTVWNAWREDNRHVRPDLNEANLSDADLTEIDLSNTELNGAILNSAFLRASNLRSSTLRGAFLIKTLFQEADLSDTDLTGAYLIESDGKWADLSSSRLHKAHLILADLTGANLTGADLSGANLTEAKLYKAQLRKADLSWADLRGTELSGAFFEFAKLWETTFGNTDLADAIGLDQCYHKGPSIVDHRTLAQSGNLPSVFLRGSGLPDFIIDNAVVLRGDPIQFYSCFISYSSHDEIFAKKLHGDLQDMGLRCWFAPENLKIGENYRHAIDDAIRLHDKLIIILSEDSIRSEWIEKEVVNALSEEHRHSKTVLIPIRIDDSVMNSERSWVRHLKRTRHIGNFINWSDSDTYDKALRHLARDLVLNMASEAGEVEGMY